MATSEIGHLLHRAVLFVDSLKELKAPLACEGLYIGVGTDILRVDTFRGHSRYYTGLADDRQLT